MSKLSTLLRPVTCLFSLLLISGTAFSIDQLPDKNQQPDDRLQLITEDDGQLRIIARAVTVRELADFIAGETGIAISADEELARQVVTIDETHKDVESLVRSISDSNAIVFEQTDDGIRLVSAVVTSKQEPVETVDAAVPTDPHADSPEKLVLGYKLTNIHPETDRSKIDHDRLLSLRNALIDTHRSAKGIDIEVPPALAARPDTHWHIVQFDGKITSERRTMLEAAGFKIGHYIPQNGLSVQAEPGRVDELRAMEGIQFVAPYHPYFKVSKEILGYMAGEATPDVAAKVEDGRFSIMTHQHETDLQGVRGLVEVESESSLDGRKMIRAVGSPDVLVQLAQLDQVQWVEVTPNLKPMNDLGNQRLRANALKRRVSSLTGTGVVVAVTDSGIDVNHLDFAQNPQLPVSFGVNSRVVKYEYRPSFTSDGFVGDTDGHGTHVAGSILGNGFLSQTVASAPGSKGPPYVSGQFAGIAPGARAVIIEDFNSFTYEEQVAIAWSNSARIANNSWGASVYEYNTDSAAWDILVRDALPGVEGQQQFTAFFAAGNDGGGTPDGLNGVAGTIGTPANAKNVITVGAVEQPRLASNLGSTDRTDSDWQVADFSSRGPVDVEDDATQLDDVRTKPDIVAPGVYVLSTQSKETNPDVLSDPFGVNWDYQSGNVNSGTNYAFFSGTSMSTPLATGVGALYLEYYRNVYGRDPSPAMMKAALVGGARNVNTLIYRHPEDPELITRTVDQGWGIIDANRSVFGTGIHPTDQLILIDQEAAINSGQFFSRQVTVNPGEGGLKIVLAWTDVPGNPAVERQLVNNLDLLVLAPGGGGYVGNRFSDEGIHSRRFTLPSPNEGDPYNNVEVILIPDATPGTYTIRAYGSDVPQGPQDFSLFIMKGIGLERRFAGERPSIAFNAKQQPYVAFSGFDTASNRQVFVKQWRGDFGDLSDIGNWRRLEDNWFSLNNSAQNVGISASLGASRQPSIAVTNDKVYVAWIQDDTAGTNVFVKYYNGTNWTALGASASGLGISSNTTFAASKPVVRIDTNGLPVVAWRQSSLISNRIHVARWNGTAWVGYGTSFSAGVGNGSQADNPTMTINSSGNPVVAWEELTTQRIHVWQWNGAAWVDLGQRGTAAFAGSPHLDSAPNGDIFLTWMQIFGSPPPYQIMAERRTGGSWVSMAGSGTNPGVSQETNFNVQVYAPNIAYSPSPTPRVFVSWLSRLGSNTYVHVKQHVIGSGSWTGIAGSDKAPGVAILPGGNTNVALAASSLGVPVVAFENNGAAGIQEVVEYGLVSDIVAPSFNGVVNAVGGTNNEVRLSWIAATDNLTLSTNMRYNVYMSTNRYPCFNLPSCDPADIFANRVATVTNLTTFTVTNLANYETRCFAVRAVDGAGNEEKNTTILYAGPTLPGIACLDRDSNTNGLPDWWEFTWFGGITSANPTQVVATCAGGLTVSNAFVFGTDPYNCDSDADGLTDADEVNIHGTFPSRGDTDEDGLDDTIELQIGSNPRNADSNKDGVSDGDMIRLGYTTTTNATGLFTVLYRETFEADSSSRTNWSKHTPNQAYPLNFWHLSKAEPSPGIPGVVRMNDRSTNTSYRMAIDASATKTNALATYNAGTNRWVAGLLSPMVDAGSASNLFVTWKEFHGVEVNQDFVEVKARAEDVDWQVVSSPKTGFSGEWSINTVDLSGFAGKTNVQILFLFTADEKNNSHPGWYVDDVVFYEGASINDGWVRDINGCPVLGATVYALGSVVVTNTVDGHKVIQPGKVFGSAFTDKRGAFSIAGLPRGKYIVKAEHPSYRVEFWNGPLFAPNYGFGNGLNRGVATVGEVTGGLVNLSTGGPAPAVHFELEPGENRSLLGIAASASGLPVSADFVTPLSAWNGSTSAPAQVTFNAMTNLSQPFNGADWATNAVAPNYYSGLMPGWHYIGLSSNLWRLNRAEVEVRQGEVSRVGLVTNAGAGYMYVAALDGIQRSIWINGVNSGSNTPALVKVQAGTHLVQLSSPLQAVLRSATVSVPLGGRTNVAFTTEQLSGNEGALVLQTFDERGHEILDAEIYLNGRLVTTNSAPELSRSTTPLTLNLVAGTYDVTFRKPGYKQTTVLTYGVLPGDSTYVYGAMYQDDLDHDSVGDYTEISAYTNLFVYAGHDDPDADGLSNRQEFDFARSYGVDLIPFNPDSDGDGMLDGAEVGLDGLTSVSNHLMYAWTTLSTNAIEGSDNLRLRFAGRYLDGIWNFGSSPTTRLSVNGDIVESTSLSHTIPAVPSVACVETVLAGIPAEIITKAISYGQPVNTRVFADSDPSLVDTDADQMWDGFEYEHQFMTNSFLFVQRILDPIGAGNVTSDPDADGLDNYREFIGPDLLANTEDSSNPRNGDSDGDAMPDGWEYAYGLDPNDNADANDDLDGDLLTNALEYQNGANPLLYDTDADGLSDGEEVILYGSNPTNPDSDGDGLFDGIEATIGTSPANWDTDGDGMPDGYEVLDALGNLRNPDVRLNPLDPSDADDDYDGDGLSNLEEYLVRDGLFGNPPLDIVWDYATDPFTADSDGDAMPDGWEVYYGLHPADPVIDTLTNITTRYSDLGVAGDLDTDGLWNLREYQMRFHLDPAADPKPIFGLSTDPRDADTDDDGLNDGEEDRAFATNPHLQDTEADHLFDGAALPPHWGEVESTKRISEFQVVNCTTCTWVDAFAMAQVPHPVFTNIIGQLATLQAKLLGNPEKDQVLTLLTGTESNIAIGAINETGPELAFEWIDFGSFLLDSFDLDATAYVAGATNYLVMDGLGGYFPVVSTQTIEGFVIEWPDVPQVTNHYDQAMNDLWQLRWPDASDLPFWERVAIDPSSPVPPARWGAASTYIPVFETKNPRDNYDAAVPTKILLDNRQLVIIGGRDGVTKHRDVWEFVIRSNMWQRSTAPLNDLPPAFFDGLSEMSAISVFKSKNTGCKGNAFEDRSGFGYPKSRPWSDSRSFDWTYLFGGWDNTYSYYETHAFYKSTDDPRLITENVGFDVGVAEYLATNVTPPSLDFLSVAETDDNYFLVGNGALVEDAILQPFSAMQINEFALNNDCDYIESAVLTLEVDLNNIGGPVDLSIYGEIKRSLDHSDPEYESSIDVQEPSARLVNAAFFIVGPTNLTVTGTGTFTIDVTDLVRGILSAPEGWDSTILGFVIENNAASGFARVDRTKSFVTVTYKPSYKIEPYWEFPGGISYEYTTRPLSARKSSAMAYDYKRDRLVLFGGIDGNDVMGDTHEGELKFDGENDPSAVSWVQQDNGIQPPARWGHSMVYDAKNERMVMFGGFDASHRPLNDLWIYEVVTEEVTEGTNTTTTTTGFWTQITEFDDTQVPMPRGGASMIYFGDFDWNRGLEGYSAGPSKQEVVLFGGTDGKTYFNDTWVLDDGTESRPPRWILVNPVGEQSQGPTPRAFASFVFAQNARDIPDPLGATEYRAGDGAKNSAFLFGGRIGALPTGSDTDRDMVDDGDEHALGGADAGRDPRIDRLVYADHPTETIPFAIKRIGSMPSSPLLPRGAIANFESLRHDDGGYASVQGLPWEVHPDPFSRINVLGGDQPGVDALLVDQTDLWYHRAAYGDPNDETDVWELGVPRDVLGGNSAPPYAYSGRWVYGTKLSGNYPDSAVIDLISPKFDLVRPSADSTDTNNVNSFFLSYMEWLDLADENDYVMVEMIRPDTPADIATRVNGTNKAPVVVVPPRSRSSNTTGEWRRVVVPLDPITYESNRFLRFRLSSDAAGSAGGWYIDDVAIMQGGEISGVLTNYGPGVEVNLYGANDGHIVNQGITSENGEFGFGMLPLGNYQIGALNATGSVIVISGSAWNASGGIPQILPAFNLVGFVFAANTILWEAVIGQTYQVEYSDSVDGPWFPLGGPILANSDPESTVDPGPIPGLRFYRVKVLNQP